MASPFPLSLTAFDDRSALLAPVTSDTVPDRRHFLKVVTLASRVGEALGTETLADFLRGDG
jgi:hypothetical protein